jgi:cathepsin B
MVGLSIMEDFYSYKSGIYHHVEGDFMGGHAMRLVGWGTDPSDNSLYWIAQNQWGDSWGEKGMVRVRAGEIGIDAIAMSCIPDIS